jgi:hypothetical protein
MTFENEKNPIIATIRKDDVEWTDTFDYKAGVKVEPYEETTFEEEIALAHMLIAGIVFLNSHHWENDWPEKARQAPALLVECNDVFAWACAEAEEFGHHEIESLYKAWQADKTWGTAKWCCIKRQQKPQPPVEAAMRKAGSWDAVMEALPANTKDAEVQAIFDSMRAK